MIIDREKEYTLTLGEIIDFSFDIYQVPKKIKQLNMTNARLPKFIDFYDKSAVTRLVTEHDDFFPSLLDSIINYSELTKTREDVGGELFNDLASALLKTDPVVGIDYMIGFGRMKPFIKTNTNIDELFDSIKTQVSTAYHNNSAFRRNYDNQNNKYLREEFDIPSLISILGDSK